MAIRLLILFFFIVLQFATQASEILITGLYKGKDLYIRNPYASGGEFCIQSIILNDVEIIKKPRVAAIKLDLSRFNMNDKIKIQIIHEESCLPDILNPGDIIFTQEFGFVSARASSKALFWRSKNEKEGGYYQTQKFKDSEWSNLERLEPKPGRGTKNYELPIQHSDKENMYKILYVIGEEEFESKPLEYVILDEPITFSPVNSSDKITFSKEAFYEVHDSEGNQIMKGTAKEIVVFPLKKGKYFLYLEGDKHEFFKR
ncbi:MAG: hypothetical protein AAF363_15440 [Bacteroidota bacterium]